MVTHQSVVEILERSCKLRQQAEEILTNRKRQTSQSSTASHRSCATEPCKMTIMLHNVRDEVKELQRQTARLSLEMHALYTAIRGVSSQIYGTSISSSFSEEEGREGEGEEEEADLHSPVTIPILGTTV